jgi:alpha-beta hydrolase superfamily lysophospholipase
MSATCGQFEGMTTSHWPAAGPPTAALLWTAGYNHFVSGPFHAWFAARLAPFNVECFGVDLPSFGRSPAAYCGVPLRAFIPSFAALVEGVVRYARSVKAALPLGTPLFLHGESMGGAVAVLALAAAPDLFAGAVLVAPMSIIGSMPPAWLQAVGEVAACLLPWAPLAPMRDIVPICFKDPIKRAEVAAGRDPLRYQGRMRLRTALELRDAAVRVQAVLPTLLRVPLLIQQGTADLVTPGAGDFVHAAAAACPDRTLVLYEDAWHALFAEPVDTRRRLVHDLVAWLAARVPAVRAAAAAAGLAQDGEALPRAGVGVVTRPAGTGPFRDGSVWSAAPPVGAPPVGARSTKLL